MPASPRLCNHSTASRPGSRCPCGALMRLHVCPCEFLFLRETGGHDRDCTEPSVALGGSDAPAMRGGSSLLPRSWSWGKAFSLLSLSSVLAVSLSRMASRVRKASFYSYFVESLYHKKMLNFVSAFFFCIS